MILLLLLFPDTDTVMAMFHCPTAAEGKLTGVLLMSFSMDIV